MPTSTTNMNLTKPGLTDTADITVIDGDMDTIDAHDHSAGKGVQIGSTGIKAGAVGTTQLAAGAATGAALGTDVATLTGVQALTNKTLTSPALSGTLSGAQTIPGAALVNGSVTATQLGANVVGTGQLAAGGVTPPAIGTGYHARVTGAAQSIANSMPAAITFNATRWDTNTFFAVANPTRLTFNKAGTYLIGFNVGFAQNGTGERLAWIRLNGTTNIGGSLRFASNPNGFTVLNGAITWQFNVGDYIELLVEQSSGGALSVNATGDDSPEFFASFLTA